MQYTLEVISKGSSVSGVHQKGVLRWLSGIHQWGILGMDHCLDCTYYKRDTTERLKTSLFNDKMLSGWGLYKRWFSHLNSNPIEDYKTRILGEEMSFPNERWQQSPENGFLEYLSQTQTQTSWEDPASCSHLPPVFQPPGVAHKSCF